ncbi:hypothetical protein [Microbacterium sp.]|uniref:hypothetical protein n=1 Tax=Microbacterium sp. TaxID=51671 RepID=UPI0039E3C2EB
MSNANRTMNRLLLGLVGVLLFVFAALAAWPAVTGDPFPALSSLADGLDRLGLTGARGIWVGVAVLSVLVLLALIWILTRTRRREPVIIDDEDVIVDGTIMRDLLQAELSTAPEVAGVSATVHRRGRRGETRVLHVRVQVRPRADLPSTLDRLTAAVAALDATLGTRVPLVLHLTTGVRSALARARRVT